jgi:hypothetical protein
MPPGALSEVCTGQHNYMMWTVTYHGDILYEHGETLLLDDSVQVAADSTVIVSGDINTSRWQCCMVTTATQGISGGWDPLLT